ncbi:MAG: hypothetical protein DRP27_05355 [Thermotogae bacterium]|nr:MAG: hypothetical protein DRP27_05355 [Thermotogota bacterium]RLG32349.1 MAG: hypothetical protein DRN97_07580 [Methanosarcinales archaeon]
MPMFNYLKVKTGQVIRSSWANELIEAIQTVAERGAVDYYGYVRKDLIPETDLALNLGIENLRFKEVHAGYGYFTYGIFPHIHLLGIKQNYQAPELTNIFDPSLAIIFDGIARVKATHEYEFYAYMYWIPSATKEAILAALNDGKPIPPNVWKEMDFTVSKSDKINVQVSPSGKVTIAVYNIPK